jgi:hypothetical protein
MFFTFTGVFGVEGEVRHVAGSQEGQSSVGGAKLTQGADEVTRIR